MVFESLVRLRNDLLLIKKASLLSLLLNLLFGKFYVLVRRILDFLDNVLHFFHGHFKSIRN